MTDANDMDVEGWRDDKFRVPDPPRRPDFLGGVDNMHWAQSSRKLAATLNQDKTGFDVKLYDPSDPTAYGLDRSITPWYRLGPPSGIPDYPHLLGKYGIQVLEAAGFLNHKFAHISNKIDGRLTFKLWRKYSRNPKERIHPVFERRQWVDITDHQYSLMQPALLLASAVVDDPVTLSYFYALAMPSASMDTLSHASAGLTADCKTMKIPDALNDDQQRETFRKLRLMTVYLQDWKFEDIDTGSYAYMDKVDFLSGRPMPASKPNTTYSIIRVNRAFMKILEYYDGGTNPDDDRYSKLFNYIHKMAGIPMSRRAHIDHVSAMYRTHYLLAHTLLHELTHAFCMAYFECQDPGPYEPWAPGDRANEQGCAFENFIFGGLVPPMTIRIPPMSDEFNVLQATLVPFGFSTSSQWDLWLSNGQDQDYLTMDLDRKDDGDPGPKRIYPVPLAWTQWLFSDDLWTDRITRFGLRVIKVPKIKKWEILDNFYGDRGVNKTGEERWNTGENMDDRDWKEWIPNWDEFYLDGLPDRDRVYKRPKWEP